MLRLLCFVGKMDAGGAETFLMKIYRKIDRKKYQFDFCVFSDTSGFYDREIGSLGGRIFICPSLKSSPITSMMAIYRIVSKEKYTVAFQVADLSFSVLKLLMARVAGAKHCVLRSTNSSATSQKTLVLHKIFSLLPRYVPNVKIAPSENAATYMFGRRAYEKQQVLLLNNGLDLSRFAFSNQCRLGKRKELGIDNALLIGHVGRFEKQKNHVFLLNLFSYIQKRKKDVYLLCVGDGALLTNMKMLANTLGIDDHVIFAGLRQDVPELMMAMDVLLFPSLYEGMPNVVIEAETTGLPCLVSDTITTACAVTPYVSFESLSASYDVWAQQLLSLAEMNIDRESCVGFMRRRGYDLDSVAQIFEKVVLSSS